MAVALCLCLAVSLSVTVRHPLRSGTIEEKIYHRQVYKQMLSKRVLVNPRQSQAFNMRNLQDLFTLNEYAEGTETGDMFGAGEIRKEDVTGSASRGGKGRGKGKARRKGGSLGDSGSDSGGERESSAVLAALFDGSDIKGAFSHDLVEQSSFVGGSDSAIRAEARRVAL